MKKQYFPIALATAVVLLCSQALLAQRMEPAEVIAKHRAAIGTQAALSAVKNQMIVADAQFTFKGAANVIAGKALVLSTSGKTLWGMNFASNDYPQDRFGFDGKNVKVARATASARSLIGEFLHNNRDILKEGLLGGALSASWPLLQEDLRKAKVKYDDAKTVDGRELIVLSYEPKGGADLSVKLFFDPTTFQHVRTEYNLVRSAAQGASVDSSAGQSGTIYKLTEEFSKFSKMGQLTLPASYRITYARTTTAATSTNQTTNRDAVWTFNVTDVGFNREIDDTSFNVEAK